MFSLPLSSLLQWLCQRSCKIASYTWAHVQWSIPPQIIGLTMSHDVVWPVKPPFPMVNGGLERNAPYIWADMQWFISTLKHQPQYVPSCDPASKHMLDQNFWWLTEGLKELPYMPRHWCNDLSPPQIIDCNVSGFNPLFPVFSLLLFTIPPLDIILVWIYIYSILVCCCFSHVFITIILISVSESRH